jgi:hypothetical protein
MAALLEAVAEALPRHNLVFADFDHLPPPAIDATHDTELAKRTYVRMSAFMYV